MKVYKVSMAGRIRAGVVLAILALIFLYSARKALGLWSGVTAKPSDPFLFNLNLNTTVPAMLLTLVAISCLVIGWYLVVELLSEVRVDESGILLHAPGYRLFYRWNEVTTVEVLNEPDEDAAACLRIEMLSAGPEPEANDPAGNATVPPEHEEAPGDEIAAFLTEADLRENRALRRRKNQEHRRRMAQVRARATRPDGRALPAWLRWLYPQARRPDRLLLYPSLEERPALLAQIEQHLARG